MKIDCKNIFFTKEKVLTKPNRVLNNYQYTNNAQIMTKPSASLLQVYFSANNPITDAKQKLETAEVKLGEHVNNNTKLTEEDNAWLNPLFRALKLTEKPTIANINGTHTHSWWEELKFDHRKELLKAVKAVLGATNYEPAQRSFNNGEYVINVNNSEINKNLRDTYTPSSFSALFKLAKEHSVFELRFDEHGFPITSSIDKDEDPLMNGNVWVTDTSRILGLIKDSHPERVSPILHKLSQFYVNETEEFKKISQSPGLFGKTHSGDPKNHHGVAHSFNPETLEGDRRFVNTRIDSMGIYLQKLSSAIMNGLEENNNMVQSIAMIGLYMKAIDFPRGISCGNWENTNRESITSDTEIVRAGLEGISQALEQGKLREVEDTYQNLKSEWGLEHHDGSFEDLLDKLIARADARLAENHTFEYINPTDPNDRFVDAALSFVPHTAKLSDDTLEDVRKNVEILEALQPLVGKNGVVRYVGDFYQDLNYELALDFNEEISFNDIKDRWQKPREQPDKNLAEWFMVSDMSRGYGVQLGKILSVLEAEDRSPTTKEMDLIKETFQGEVEFINRAFARITDTDSTKANGIECPSWKTPESYMAVSSLRDIGIDKEKTHLPGVNTPLAWAQASLYDASKVMESNLERLEALGLQEQL